MRTNLLERYILRCSPMAHQAWLSLIDKTLLLRSLPFAAFDTQTSTILQDGGQTANNEPISGISVICSASSATSNLSGVVSSKRGQVLDGVVRYGDDRVIVLESKLTEGASEYQAVNINLNGQPVKFERAVHISWRDVLAAFSDIADERRALVGGAERLIIKDFLRVRSGASHNGAYATSHDLREQGHPARGS